MTQNRQVTFTIHAESFREASRDPKTMSTTFIGDGAAARPRADSGETSWSEGIELKVSHQAWSALQRQAGPHWKRGLAVVAASVLANSSFTRGFGFDSRVDQHEVDRLGRHLHQLDSWSGDPAITATERPDLGACREGARASEL